MKRALGKALFRIGNIRQLHIVGTSRSGTTMLHVAMSAFRNIHLTPRESRVEAPFLAERSGLVLEAWRRKADPLFLITKRDHGWAGAQSRAVLLERIATEDFGIILINRDPRDVMLSRHGTQSADDPNKYVSPAHWRWSTEGAMVLEDALAGHPMFMTLSYERLARHPQQVEAELAERFGLERRANSPGLHAIAANSEAMQDEFDDYIIPALKGVRDIDPNSVGKWRAADGDPAAPLLADPAIRPVFERYCERHDYPARIESSAA